MDESHLDSSSKQFRRRKKHLHRQILSQMEFYFGDSNLSKDRFLSKLIAKDPYIELATFLEFNKIKTLTKKMEDLVSAIKKSKMLELSDDGLKVRRTTEIQQRDDIDKCTIYVERIPVDFTHDSLIKIFSEFGKVEYVSIPKYKDNHLMKGFAFVEFDTPESAYKTLEHFASIGCRLPSQMPPEKLLSVNTFILEQSRLKQDTAVDITDSTKSKQNEECSQDGGSQENNEEPATEKKINKRSLENSESDVEGEEQKKRKVTAENTETGDNSDALKTSESSKQKNKDSKKRKVSNDNQECEIKKLKHSEGNQESSMDGDEVKSSSCPKNKETRKRKGSMEQKTDEKKVKIESASGVPESDKQDETAEENQQENTAEIGSEEEKHEEESNDENESVKRKRKRKKNQKRAVLDFKELGLQVLSKCEWKRLRNKYLDLQRSHMKNMKQQLNKTRYNNAQYLQTFNISKANVTVSSSSENKTDTDDGKKKTIFIPGTIVHVHLPEACSDIKALKNELKTYSSDIQYVDASEGQFSAFVRFSTRDASYGFLKCPFAATMNVLTGEDEQQYWNKIQKDREEKLKKGKIKQRGRDKLLKKSEKVVGKHIIFEYV